MPATFHVRDGEGGVFAKFQTPIGFEGTGPWTKRCGGPWSGPSSPDEGHALSQGPRTLCPVKRGLPSQDACSGTGHVTDQEQLNAQQNDKDGEVSEDEP